MANLNKKHLQDMQALYYGSSVEGIPDNLTVYEMKHWWRNHFRHQGATFQTYYDEVVPKEPEVLTMPDIDPNDPDTFIAWYQFNANNHDLPAKDRALYGKQLLDLLDIKSQIQNTKIENDFIVVLGEVEWFEERSRSKSE